MQQQSLTLSQNKRKRTTAEKAQKDLIGQKQ